MHGLITDMDTGAILMFTKRPGKPRGTVQPGLVTFVFLNPPQHSVLILTEDAEMRCSVLQWGQPVEHLECLLVLAASVLFFAWGCDVLDCSRQGAARISAWNKRGRKDKAETPILSLRRIRTKIFLYLSMVPSSPSTSFF